MTIIELLDTSPLQNILPTLTFNADRVYFFGSNKRTLENAVNRYRAFFEKHGVSAKIDCVFVPKYDISFAVGKMTELAKADDELIFDATGGSDYLLSAVGIAYEKCKSDGVQLQHFSIRSGKLATFGKKCFTPEHHPNIRLSCDDIIELHGGKIVYASEKHGGTVKWNFSDGFREDTEKMWSLCRADCRSWNRNASKMGELDGLSKAQGITADTLSVCVTKKSAEKKPGLLSELAPHLRSLAEAGLICDYADTQERISFRFKSEQVKSCLLKAGNVLELMTLLAARQAKNRKGKPIFCDTMSGVVLDWDGEIHHGSASCLDTENEIDGLFIKGTIPCFVSCKNGGVDENELYKLSCVAKKFGDGYAKKALIATDLQKNYSSLMRFRSRAEEMNIKIIDGVHRMTPDEFARQIATI